jgi:ribonuclease BN (tRNA processing enzyme)
MKLTVIGYWGAFPPANSATSAYLLEQDGFSLLIDCGSGAIAQLQNYLDLTKLDALIVSHYHHDHKADVGCLQYSMLLQQAGGLRQQSFPIYGHCEDPEQFEALSYQSYTIGEQIAAEASATIGPWTVTFCPTNHPVFCLAMRFEHDGKSIVYTADTHWTDELVSFAADCDLLLVECSVYDQTIAERSGHLTPELAGQLAVRSHAKQVVLTHLPQYGDHNQMLQTVRNQFTGPVQIASAGLTLNI